MTPNTDIVISVRGTREFQIERYFDACVSSICKHTSNYRFIFVDDNSDTLCRQAIEQLASQFRDSILIRTHFQHWFTRAFNLGLRMIRTPWCVAINCDCVVDSGWLDELYAIRDEARNTGPVGLVGSVFSPEESRRYDFSVGEDYVTGHCWLLNMEALTEASISRGQPGIYLDEIHPHNIHIRSDIEICRALNRLGWHCVKSFKSRVGHHGGKSWGHRLAQVQTLRLEDVSYKYQ